MYRELTLTRAFNPMLCSLILVATAVAFLATPAAAQSQKPPGAAAKSPRLPGPLTMQVLMNRLAAQVRTPEILGRTMLANIYKIAAKHNKALAAGDTVTVPVLIKVKVVEVTMGPGGGGMSGCFSTTVCYEDEAAGQSVCEEAEVCGEFEGTTSID